MNNAHSLSELIPKLANWHRIIKKRAFELALSNFENSAQDPLTNFCITSAGGNALAELGLSFMQANSMIIMSDNKKEIARCRKFAVYFSEILAQIGYAYNANGVSLNNPSMTKGAEEWKQYYSGTLIKNIHNIAEIRTLLDSVYFCGDEELYWDYRAQLASLLQERRFILKELLAYQKRVKLPISDYEYFVTDGLNEGIDLKSHALDFLTNLTQIYAIAGEISHTDTPRRLRHMVRIGLIPEKLSLDILFAYETIINIIIHEHLSQQHRGLPINFYVNPSELSVRASKHLKLALHISKSYLNIAAAKFEG
jgi:signal-transduction protein with cAMP-binding, CBS, and nucleotidyltransferase domain